MRDKKTSIRVMGALFDNDYDLLFLDHLQDE